MILKIEMCHLKEVLVAQLCLTLCYHRDCSPPGSSVHGILQTRILEWVAIPFSRGTFLTQGSNPGLPHCRQIPNNLRHQGSPILMNMNAKILKKILANGIHYV